MRTSCGDNGNEPDNKGSTVETAVSCVECLCSSGHEIPVDPTSDDSTVGMFDVVTDSTCCARELVAGWVNEESVVT